MRVLVSDDRRDIHFGEGRAMVPLIVMLAAWLGFRVLDRQPPLSVCLPLQLFWILAFWWVAE